MKNDVKEFRTSNSCVYFLGMIGSFTYYVSTAVGFWAGVLGFFKALVWPAFLTYEAFGYLSI